MDTKLENENKQENLENNDIPVFTPPEENDIPTFTPPVENDIPTFTPPADAKVSGATCYHHPEERAVGTCARCGKNICKECAETCSVSGGEYSGKHLCYDCCQSLFKDDEQKLKKDKNKIMFQYILTIIGVFIGGVFGADSGDPLMIFIFAMIGGAFLSAIKPIGSALIDMTKGVIELAVGGSIISAIMQFLVGIVKFIIVAIQCTIRTIIKLVKYTNYLIKASKAIKADREALQQLKDFMTYMDVRQRNKGVDLEKLMGEGSELYNNSYARALRENGEEAADNMLRQATTTIAENGEIIRSFAM